MGMDTGIANRLRSAGVRVVECDGWQSRGSSSFSPRGSVNHHTAGSASGSCPSLNVCINGRSDLPGPLCNVMQSREPDGNDIAYVIAAGRANHAGDGGWKGLSGNSSVYGLEIEHTGTSTLSSGRQNIAARIHAAMFGGDPGMVCQHYEWTTRKIDAATNVDGNQFRSLVASGGGGGGGGTGEWDEMATKAEIQEVVRGEVAKAMQWLIAGIKNTTYDPADPDYAWLNKGPNLPQLMAEVESDLLRTSQYIAGGMTNTLYNPAKQTWMEDATTLPMVMKAVEGDAAR